MANTSTGGLGFAVADVLRAKEPLAEVGYQAAVEQIIGRGRIESCPARLVRKLVPCEYHAFVACVQQAFNDHRMLALSPDHIWLLICQGFADHVNANAEQLRQRFVSFEGKQKIGVQADDFVKGAMENPWERVLPEFLEKMRAYLGSTADLLKPDFSTTQSVEVAACQIVMMGAMQPYFEYELYSGCGIPRIILEGTPEDWTRLRDRAQAFRAFDLEWWIGPLTEVLDQFCQASQGQVDRGWWNSFFKINSQSGGPYVTGYITRFFPYLADYETKRVTVRQKFATDFSQPFTGLTHPSFPTGLSRVPFTWRMRKRRLFRPPSAERFKMEFIAGFVGIRQDRNTLAIRPEIGWAVQDATCA